MEIPYAAGLLDADGWVRINHIKKKDVYQLKVGVVNLHEPTLELGLLHYVIFVFHLHILLDGIRRKDDCNNANDVKQCAH